MNWVILTSLTLGLLFGLLPGQNATVGSMKNDVASPAFTTTAMTPASADSIHGEFVITPEVTSTAYLPFIPRAPNVIAGLVFSSGLPIKDYPVSLVKVELWLMHSPIYPVASVRTDAHGYYAFKEITSTHAMEQYRVETYPAGFEGHADLVASNWFDYTAGQQVDLAPLDASAVLNLYEPRDGATIQLPYTFKWTSTVKNVTQSWLLIYLVPFTAGKNAGTATEVTLSRSDPNMSGIEGNHMVWVRAATNDGFVDSQPIYVTFAEP